ncbi:MAG: hypothetical protein Q8O93_04490 [bacterium]|nr:hypothetical protein [bacterium]
MSKMNQAQEIIRLFYENELKTRELYRLYALKFPEYQGLWDNLARKENDQLKVLKQLSADSRGGRFVRISEYAWQIIKYVSDFIDRQLTKAKSRRIALKDALATALRLEQSILKKPGELLTPLSLEIESAFNWFKSQSRRHIKKLEQAYDEVV